MLCPFCRECDESFDHIFSCPEGLICHISDKIHDISKFVNIESNRLMKSINSYLLKYEKYREVIIWGPKIVTGLF